jgi:hypothetical protein
MRRDAWFAGAVMITRRKLQVVMFAPVLISAFCMLPAAAQQAVVPSAEPAAELPPIDHESGTIDQVLTADDGGYRMRGYVVNWRSSRVFVSGAPAEPRQPGAGIDLTVYRSSVSGQRALRFAIAQPGDDAGVAQEEVRNAEVSITSGTAKVQNVLQADSDGYHFIAYLVNWHDRQIAVVDPLLRTPRAIGDQINFRVYHTGADENRQLSFAMGD